MTAMAQSGLKEIWEEMRNSLPDGKTKDGMPFLIFLIQNKFFKQALALLKIGANPNVIYNERETIVHFIDAIGSDIELPETRPMVIFLGEERQIEEDQNGNQALYDLAKKFQELFEQEKLDMGNSLRWLAFKLACAVSLQNHEKARLFKEKMNQIIKDARNHIEQLKTLFLVEDEEIDRQMEILVDSYWPLGSTDADEEIDEGDIDFGDYTDNDPHQP